MWSELPDDASYFGGARIILRNAGWREIAAEAWRLLFITAVLIGIAVAVMNVPQFDF